MKAIRFVTAASIAVLIGGPLAVAHAMTDGELQSLVDREIKPLLAGNGAGGAAVAVRVEGRTVFFNYGFADLAGKRPITSDSLFNLASIRKVFDATLLAQMVLRGEVSFDDPVAKYVAELSDGGYVRRVTLGQLAAHTSGLLLRTDYPPWPEWHYTLPDFIRALNAWTPDRGQEPGQQHIYTHAGYVLLGLALERRVGTPITELIDRRVLAPLGLTRTAIVDAAARGRAALAPALMHHVVQGYSEDGALIGEPGDQQSYFHFPGAGQMFSSARNLAVVMAAELGEESPDPLLQQAMQMTQQGVFRISADATQALAWEVSHLGGAPIVDKPGGLDSSSTYIGIVPSKKVGIVILMNRGNQHPFEIARSILLPALAR